MSTTTPALQPLSGTYAADPTHSSFRFAVKHMGVSTFRGSLDDVAATLVAGPDGVALEGVAQVESISIRAPEMLRGHVLGEEFFDVANHPEVRFVSERAELAADGRATVDGQLTIRGATLPVHAEGSWSPEVAALGTNLAQLALSATIDRTAYGLNWQAELPSGGKALANDVTLEIELELVPQEA